VLRLIDTVCQAYRTHPRAIWGSPVDEGWSWRELIVAAQMARRRWDEEAEERERARALAEAQRERDMLARALEGP